MLHNMHPALHHCFFYAVHLSVSELAADLTKMYTSILNKPNLILCSAFALCTQGGGHN
jgi:hypothetical protein